MFQLFITVANFVIFIAISFLVYYIPGYVILAAKRKKLADGEIITLSLALGIVVFVLTAIALALLGFRYLLLPVALSICLFTIIKYKFAVFTSWKIFIKNKTLLALIILGMLIQGFINFPSGYLYNDGLHFFSSHGHDGLWHIALMEEVKKNLPPKNPIFAGEGLFNYHYLVDVLMGEFSRVFPFFSNLDLYFRFFPVIFSSLLGLSVFTFVCRWQQNQQTGYLAVFFTYFVGSFGYIVTFLKEGNLLAGETVFWAAQQNTILGNPPHAISHGLLVSFFLAFHIYLKERRIFFLIIAFLLSSMLAGFKSSGGLVMLAGLGAATVVDFLNRRSFITIGFAFFLGLSNFITFKAMTTPNAASFLVFLPWWFIRTMVVDKLDWIDLELKRQHYLSKGTWHAYLRVFQLEFLALMIFILGNLGMRMLGLFSIFKSIFSKIFFKDPIEAMLITIGLSGLLMVIFFVQKGIIYNNIQFMQYFLLIVGFYGAVSTYYLINLFKTRWIKVCLLAVLVALSTPTVIGNLNEFYGPGKSSLAKISNQQLAALEYMRDHSDPDVTILTVPFNKYLKDKFQYQPRPIYAWYSTAYIPAIAARKTYLTAEEQALITGYSIDSRLAKMKSFFKQSDTSWNRQYLKDERISYVYVAKDELAVPLNIQENNLEIFFENNETIIYRVKP